MRPGTMDRVGANGNGGPVASPAKERRHWGERGKSDPICRAVGLKLGIAPKTAEHRLRDLPREVVAFIHEFHEQQADLRLARFKRLILAAFERRHAPPFSAGTFILAQEADAAEDIAEVAFHTDPSDANLDRLIRCGEEELRWEEARQLALLAERDRRRRERA